MSDNNKINQEVEQFNKGNLRKTSTSERNYKPTQAEIDEEKRANQESKK